MSNVEKMWQELKAWADAANASKMPSHHANLEVFLQKLLAESAIDPLQYSRAFTAITYADHCTAPLLARIAELEAALSEARSWIGDGEDSICSFAYPKQCSSDYVEMVNRVDVVLGKGDAA